MSLRTFFTLFRAKLALTRPLSRHGYYQTWRPAHPALRRTWEEGGVVLRPYEQLAAHYHDYARRFCPGYASYLAALPRAYGHPIGSVLELACGAGTLTRRLTDAFPEVVGLDRSEPMLAEARRRLAGRPNVRLVAGDFREFDLGRRFDAVVCSSDSLNYVRKPEELTLVFGCVRRHLVPGGLFAFDVLNRRCFRAADGRVTNVRLGDEPLALSHDYDEELDVGVTTVLFDDAFEEHRRVPIEASDVRRSAAEGGMVLVDRFSSALPLMPPGLREFYLLRAG
jgi:SAM-dependent methyltransferase